MNYSISKQKKDAALINQSGRQRMLCQAIVKNVLLIYEQTKNKKNTGNQLAELKELLLLWQNTHLELQNMNQSSAPHELSPEILNLFQKINPIYNGITENIRSWILFIENKQEAKTSYFIESILESEKRFIKYMDQITNQFEKEAEEKVSKLDFLNSLLLTLIIVLIVLMSLFIIFPGFKKLNILTKELKEANNSKDLFFSIISHDLRGSVGTIDQTLSTLLIHFDDFKKKDLKSYLEILSPSSHKIWGLLGNLLEWSKTQRNLKQIQPENFNLKIFIEETLDILKINAENKNILFENQIPSEITIFADKQMTATVIRNLASNSLKFTQSGGKIIFSAFEKENFVQIKVQDTGIGLKENEIDQLFKIDTHYTRPGTDSESGSGLGLILCKEFIEKNGGEIWIESKPEEGTAVFFTLPLGEV